MTTNGPTSAADGTRTAMATVFPIAWTARRTIRDATSPGSTRDKRRRIASASFFFASGFVAERARVRRGAREPVVHRFPGGCPRRRFDDDALGAARIELAQVRVEVVAVARRVGARSNP